MDNIGRVKYDKVYYCNLHVSAYNLTFCKALADAGAGPVYCMFIHREIPSPLSRITIMLKVNGVEQQSVRC